MHTSSWSSGRIVGLDESVFSLGHWLLASFLTVFSRLQLFGLFSNLYYTPVLGTKTISSRLSIPLLSRSEPNQFPAHEKRARGRRRECALSR